MRKEERDALIQAQDFDWDDFEDLPEVVQEKQEQNQKKSFEEKDFANSPLDSVHLSSALRRSDVRLENVINQLNGISSQSDRIAKQVQEILNFCIRQSEMFEKLLHKFPNIRVFQNSFDETQDVIEKVIKIQEESRQCVRDSLSALEVVENQKKEHKSLSMVAETLITLSGCMEKIILGELNPVELNLKTKQPKSQD